MTRRGWSCNCSEVLRCSPDDLQRAILYMLWDCVLRSHSIVVHFTKERGSCRAFVLFCFLWHLYHLFFILKCEKNTLDYFSFLCDVLSAHSIALCRPIQMSKYCRPLQSFHSGKLGNFIVVNLINRPLKHTHTQTQTLRKGWSVSVPFLNQMCSVPLS